MFQSLFARAREARASELDAEGASEGGFTLIELMVVLLIIAILLAIAIPTFLGVTGSAKDRSAQSTATNAETNAVAYYQNAQTYDATATSTTTSQGLVSVNTSTAYALVQAEPSFGWVSNGVKCSSGNNPPCVSVMPVDAAASNDGQGIILAVYSNTATCWFIANLQANPVVTATTGFVQAGTIGTIGAAGTEAGAANAGTFYAKLVNPGASGANCKASYATTDTAGWNWGSSFSNPGVNAT
ncbi:MAG TPA: prepilin-type N-terminal cleavage/methylation domain-containing protein [Acidimicrobiales bacterium]|nr:prepilin-type N-terminal cleavage/methylation domain-containing protein [Acidimicrobiales bacterium]